MICVAISDKNYEYCLKLLKKVELAEIRLDLTEYTLGQIKEVFSQPVKLIATCRPGKYSDNEREQRIITAIESGAEYVDIELEAQDEMRRKIISLAHANGCDVIVSYHNFEFTPEENELTRIVKECFSIGGDVAKIATSIRNSVDNARIMGLYAHSGRIVALGMGEQGKITRIMATFLGAEFTFAAMDEGEATAPGQINYSKLQSIIKKIEDL